MTNFSIAPTIGHLEFELQKFYIKNNEYFIDSRLFVCASITAKRLKRFEQTLEYK